MLRRIGRIIEVQTAVIMMMMAVSRPVQRLVDEIGLGLSKRRHRTGQ
jgi:hypothetical protein